MLMATMSASPDEAGSAADVDHALARASAGGDVAAFETLYRRHAGRIHGVILRLVGHQHSRAEDLTQEAFVRAWQALPGFRFESAVGTWLHRLAANTALMELRSRAAGMIDIAEDALVTRSAPVTLPPSHRPFAGPANMRSTASAAARALLVL